MTREQNEGEQTEDRLVRAAELLGGPVVAPEGQALGRLEELLLNVGEGRISHAVLASAGGAEGERFSPLPWGRFAWEGGAALLAADVTAHHLSLAPQFRPRKLDSQQWQDEILGYYDAMEEETGVAGFDTAAEGAGVSESPTGRAALGRHPIAAPSEEDEEAEAA